VLSPICLDGLRKITRNLRMVDVPSKTQNRIFPESKLRVSSHG
jgi:hypothetical protein